MSVRAAANAIAYGQVGFVALMTCCLALNPSQVAVKRGLSYYGTHLETIVPYSLAFVFCVGFTALGVARMRRDSRRAVRLRAAVTAILVLSAAVPLTPYSVDEVFDVLHVGLTSVLFSAAFLFGAWLARAFVPAPPAQGWFLVQAAAGSLIFVSQIGLLDYMIPSQFLFQLAFALLLVGAVRRVQEMGRAGIEPATLGLKVPCSTD
jgi:hypothetical protein